MGIKIHPVGSGRLRAGDVTRTMVDARAHEFAVLAGHVSPHVIQANHAQAKRELTCETDPERQK